MYEKAMNMRPPKLEIEDDEFCDCMNCRLKRMEAAIGEMQGNVLKLIEMRQAGIPIKGMPADENRIKGKA